MVEFDLSEKIYNADGFSNASDDKVILIEDVKEFIRLLKEELRHNVFEVELSNGIDGVLKDVKVMHEFIDKLAGEKLK